MAPPVGLKEKPKYLLQFMDPKLEPRRMKIQKKHPLKLFGSPRVDKLVGTMLNSAISFHFKIKNNNYLFSMV